MRFAPLDRNFTGVSLPVAALRTRDSCGVGEFADLAALGGWCRSAGLEVIQLLPVNDTGGNSSPYSALSAFALHPLYLRLQALPGAERYAADIRRFQEESAERERAAGGRFSYGPCRAFKLSILFRLYDDNAAAISRNAAFERWRADNPWVLSYAVFTALRQEHNDAPWSGWPEMSAPRPDDIARWWDAHPARCLPVAWGQFQLEAQLAEASRALRSMGVFLKGDLPILMSRESADVWADRSYFDLSACAGAPPDMFSPDGQQWGFPVYDWDHLETDGYRWWKDRLRQAGQVLPRLPHRSRARLLPHLEDPAGGASPRSSAGSPRRSGSGGGSSRHSASTRAGCAGSPFPTSAGRRSPPRRERTRPGWRVSTCGASGARTCSTLRPGWTANPPSPALGNPPS